MTNVSQRIEVLAQLGRLISEDLASHNPESTSPLSVALNQAQRANGWFTQRFSLRALNYWAEALTIESLEDWTKAYSIDESSDFHVGLVLAGNIPLVGFHDIVCVYLSGHKAVIKPSSQDTALITFMIQRLIDAGATPDSFRITPGRLDGFDAIIATGSGNSARYFEQYFGAYPSIIRKNRTGIAVLNGNESDAELSKLMEDVFTYFGLGCRNVTKLFLPKGFDLNRLFAASLSHSFLIENNKYLNNFLYQRTLLTMQQVDVLENDLFMLHESDKIFSPVSVLKYEWYDDQKALNNRVSTLFDQIQCVVGSQNTNFGTAQKPRLDSYADGIDTLRFLLSFASVRLPN